MLKAKNSGLSLPDSGDWENCGREQKTQALGWAGSPLLELGVVARVGSTVAVTQVARCP